MLFHTTTAYPSRRSDVQRWEQFCSPKVNLSKIIQCYQHSLFIC